MTRPEVVAFDVNETLSDFAALSSRCDAVGAAPGTFDRWFAATLRDGMALAAAGAFAPFAEIGRHLLTEMLGHDDGVSGDPATAAADVLAGIDELRVHDDVPEGLRRLHSAGVRLATLTNGAAARTDGLLVRAGLRELVEHVLDVETVRRWKPAPEPYRHAAEVCGVAPERLALVAVHPWDVDGARRARLVGAFLARHGSPAYPAYLSAPTVTATTLPDLADRLLDL